MKRAAALGAALAATLGAGCGNGSAAPVSAQYPEGTALTVNGLPVSAAEVDAAAHWAALLEPLAVHDQHRRYALHGLILPRAVCRSRFPEKREDALERARAWAAYERGQRASAPGGGAAGPPAPPERVSGDAPTLSLWLFGPARELTLGAWSDPLELVGTFAIARLDARGPAEFAGQEVISLSLRQVPYLPEGSTEADLETWIDESRLEIVDAAWEDVVTEEYKHRMRGQP